MRAIKYLVVHHNGVAGRTIDNIRRSHKARGWSDIGYHFVIHEDGSVHHGRPVARSGAHARGLNANSLGVCVIGNGNNAGWNPKQKVALKSLLQGLRAVYKLPASAVIGHREVNAYVAKKYRTRKVCPGRLNDLDKLRSELA